MKSRILNLLYTFLAISVIPLVYGCSSTTANDFSTLEHRLRSLIAQSDEQVGMAVIIDGTDTICINDKNRYPMMSVYKFHQALAVTSMLQRRGISLDSLVYIKRECMRPGTYSPFRDAYPNGNDYYPISKLLTYTLQLSDNIACDVLFGQILSVEQTDLLIRSFGFSDFSISATEKEMQDNPMRCYDNWTTPLASAVLLDQFVSRKIVTGSYYDFILNTMLSCSTGANRLPRPFSDNGKIRIGHKTGTSGRNDHEQYIGVNDIGFVYLPNGRRYSVAVFVKDARGNLDEVEGIISKISAELYSVLSK